MACSRHKLWTSTGVLHTSAYVTHACSQGTSHIQSERQHPQDLCSAASEHISYPASIFRTCKVSVLSGPTTPPPTPHTERHQHTRGECHTCRMGAKITCRHSRGSAMCQELSGITPCMCLANPALSTRKSPDRRAAPPCHHDHYAVYELAYSEVRCKYFLHAVY